MQAPRISFLPLVPLVPLAVTVAVATACGGNAPPPQAPAAPKPVASAPPPPPPDLSPVPDPASLVVSGRIAKLGASLATVHGWTKLPMPRSEQVTEIITTEAIGPVVDLDQPIDFAVGVTGTGSKMKDLSAVAAAVKDPDKVKASLAERYKLVPGDNGVLLIQGLGKTGHGGGSTDDDGDDDGKPDTPRSSGDEDEQPARVCELAPAYGDAPVRLVCAMDAAALRELGPWLTRTAPRATSTSDLHVDLRMAPIKPVIQDQKRLAGMVMGGVLTTRLGLSGAREIAAALGADLADFATDLDALALDVTLGDAGARATASLKLGATASTLARIATGHAERSGPAPAAFWQLPADTDVAGFGRGVDEANLARARDLALALVGDALADQGVKDADRKAVSDALGKLVSPAAVVFGSGIEAGAVKTAVAADRDQAADRAESKRGVAEALLGWRVVEVDDAPAKVTGAFKELAAALGRPSIAAAYRAKNKDVAPPSLRAAPVAKAAGLPAGTVHYVLEIPQRDRRPNVKPPRRGENGPPPRPNKPLKPFIVHLYAAPDGTRTWIGVAGDDALAASRVASAMGQAGDKVSGKADLAPFKDGSVGAAGFVTLRGVSELADVMGLVTGGSVKPAENDFEEAAQMPHQGMTPVLFSATAQQGSPGAVLDFRVPLGAIDDLVTVVLKHGGF